MALSAAVAPTFFAKVGDDTISESGNIPKKFKMQKQGPSKWCWVEVAASVQAFYADSVVERCTLAQSALLKFQKLTVDCCLDQDSCNKEMEMADALKLTDNLRQSVDAAATEEQLTQEIPKRGEGESEGKGSPIVCVLDDRENGGHATVVTGWFKKGGELFVLVADPLNGGNKTITAFPFTFKELTNGLGFDWKQTHFTKESDQ